MAVPRYYIHTFGCQMNVDDSERLAAALAEQGYAPAETPEAADLILINTCSVRAKAEQKAYSLLGSLRRLKERKPGLRVALAGCLAQQEGPALLERFDHLDLVLGTGAVYRFRDILERPGRAADVGLGLELPTLMASGGPAGPVKSQVTIMQGCDNFCAYCVVPSLRGRERSRPAEEVLAEVKAKVANGVREINLLGQNVNSYRHDDWDFVRLLQAVAATPGLLRLRFTTSHPKDVTPAFIAAMGSIPNLGPFLHLPFQAGSDRILDLMNRRYTQADYLGLVAALRAARPGLALSADAIVGFPGETEADFQATLDLIERVRFDSLYSFRYSDRPGTKAAGLPDKVDPAIAGRRLSLLQARQRQITLESNQACLGRRLEVLVEGPAKRGRLLTGRSGTNKVVNFPGSAELVGRLVEVEVTWAGTNSLRGTIVGR